MATPSMFWTICLSVLLLSSNHVSGRFFETLGKTRTMREDSDDNESEAVPVDDDEAVSTERILVKRPEGTYYKTILSTDFGGMRSLLSVMVVIEVEDAIKRYIVANPSEFPEAEDVTSVDEIEIDLADYFDCITGISSGAWNTLYLASRGGQGASAAIFEDPEIFEKYGYVRPGSAAGLRVFYREYGPLIYNQAAINTSAGEVGDITNPEAPGVATPLYPIEGLEESLTAFLGQTTLADLDTSVLIATFDLISGFTTLFAQNRFGDTPRTSSGVLIPRVGAKTEFTPDLVFEDGDFYLVDVGAGAGSSPMIHAAVSTSDVDDDSREFLLVDGSIPVEDAAVPTSFYVAAENGLFDFERLAILSIGAGRVQRDFSPFANAGLAGWLDGFTLLNLYSISGRESQVSLLDYIFYANPVTRPYQYLRVQASGDENTDLGTAFSVVDQAVFLDVYEETGVATAELYREAIDVFVKDFIFGSS